MDQRNAALASFAKDNPAIANFVGGLTPAGDAVAFGEFTQNPSLAGAIVLGAGLIGLDALKSIDNAPISMDDALQQASDFLDMGSAIKSVDSSTGVQFIQQSVDEAGNTVTKRAGIDVNPASAHVQKEGPHLNLQTQVNGKIQPGDPHTPIDPKTVRDDDF